MNVKKDAQFYLLILECFVTELRLEEEKDAEDIRKLAYILHNVPPMLRRDFDEQEAKEGWDRIRRHAQHGELEIFNIWEGNVIRQLDYEAAQAQDEAQT